MTAPDATTPLLGGSKPCTARPTFFSPALHILIAGFLISVSLSLTQVPILYAFRIMECDQFYKDHTEIPFDGSGDRCARSEIDGGTAAQVSILGLTTTFYGVINLFVAGWQIRRFGPKAALMIQTIAPAVRVATQAVAVVIGARAGIIMIQSSQAVNVLGGPAGYLLALNTAVSEVTVPDQRTAVFGQLQGSIMLGTALGYLLGGIIGDTFGIEKPFQTACLMFVSSCLYVAVVVPYINRPAAKTATETETAEAKPASSTVFEALFGSLSVLVPRRMRTADGSTRKHYGAMFLALGVFTGVLATGYAPLLIIMYATAAFDFHPTENGYLMSINSVIRGFFLLFLFPEIIRRGRKWYTLAEDSTNGASGANANSEYQQSAAMLLPTDPHDFDPVAGGMLTEEEPTQPPPADDTAGRVFDLVFLRWSLVADGLVTVYTAFATKHWHIYVAGFLLPLASGSAPASKGVITNMCPAGMQADALQVMTLVENVAMLSTLGLFGYIFSAFSAMGKAYLTFFCNAGVAMVAVLILTFSNFPPPGSSLDEEEERTEQGAVDGSSS